MNIVRIPGYTIPTTELNNVTKLADYYGLKTEIPNYPKTNIITGILYDLYYYRNVISDVKYMLFHNIRENNRSSLEDIKPKKLKIDFKIRYTNNLKTLIIRENIFMSSNPHMDISHNEHKIICPEFLPLFQESFIIYILRRNKLTESVKIIIIC